MDKTTPEDLRAAYKREKDPKVIKRMAAVNMVCMNGESTRHTADSLMHSKHDQKPINLSTYPNQKI